MSAGVKTMRTYPASNELVSTESILETAIVMAYEL